MEVKAGLFLRKTDHVEWKCMSAHRSDALIGGGGQSIDMKEFFLE